MDLRSEVWLLDAPEMTSSSPRQQPESDQGRAYLGFVPTVRSQFAFLRDLGFHERTAQATFVRFEARDVFIEIYHGRRSYELGVEIGRSVDVDGEEVEQKFHISDILPILASERRYRPTTARDREPVARFVAELAPLSELLLVQILKDKDTIFADLSEGLARRSDQYLEGIAADRLRTRASDAWRAKDLATVVNAYEEIESELKTVQLRDSERGRLEYARKHLNPDGDP